MPACRLFIFLGLLAAALAGCRRAAEAPVARPTEIRHPLTGLILKVEAERGVLIVQHEEIKGYMPANRAHRRIGVQHQEHRAICGKHIQHTAKIVHQASCSSDGRWLCGARPTTSRESP